MKNTILLLITFLFSSSLLSQDCDPSTAYIELDGNNIKAGLRIAGDLWWDGTMEGRYIAPNPPVGVPEVSAIFSGAFWLAATDPAGNLKLAAQHYPQGNITDYWPGPLDEEGEIGNDACANWDRFFKVDKTDVEAHILDFADNGQIDNKIESIYSWPGRNNPNFEQFAGFELMANTRLAPYADLDGDFTYEPEDGEYPLIKGTQSIWWVFNDAGNQHFVTGADKLQVEIQVMAYAQESENTAINNTTFYQYKVINKGFDHLENIRLGLWVDPDLGCYTDDFIGYDSTRHMAFIYNEDAIDGSVGSSCPAGINTYGDQIPMVGIAPVSSSYDYDDQAKFIVYNDNHQPPMGDPNYLTEYYNILQGLWTDGTPQTEGGFGFNPGSSHDTVCYTYPGEPSDPEGWSMCSANIPFTDRKMVMSSGGINLGHRESLDITYAVIFVEDVAHPCPSLDKLRNAYDELDNNLILDSGDSKSVLSKNLIVYPNPSTGLYQVEASIKIQSLSILDFTGNVIRSITTNGSITEIDLADLSDGMYYILAQDKLGNTMEAEKIVKLR